MNVSEINVLMHAVAYLYDHLGDCPVWMRRLTPGQLEHIAKLMVSWHAGLGGSCEIQPLKQVEKQAITRAITLSGGDVIKAAKALGIGKTTLYRKMKQWGYSNENRVLIHKASVLVEVPVGGAMTTTAKSERARKSNASQGEEHDNSLTEWDQYGQ
jgi:transposase-like protein